MIYYLYPRYSKSGRSDMDPWEEWLAAERAEQIRKENLISNAQKARNKFESRWKK